MEQAPQTIEQVVSNIAHLITLVGGLTTLLTVGVTQFVKEFTDSSKIKAIFAVLFGFFAGIVLMKLFGNSWFSPLSIFVAVASSFGAPGVFSVSKTIAAKKSA